MPKNISPTNPVPLGSISVPVNGDPMDADNDLAAVVQKLLNMMGGSLQTATPTGTVASYAGNAAPDGWLLCDGRAVSRSTYPALFNVLGTRYGAGDSSTTFNLPDLRGRVSLGAGQGINLSSRPLASTGGEEAHALTLAEMPAHSHLAPTANSTLGGGFEVPDAASANGGTGGYQAYDYVGAAPTQSTGGNAAHNIMQPYITLNYIVRI